MKRKFFAVVFLLIIFTQYTFAQEKGGTWDKWKYLIGYWNGDGSGKPGKGSGYFTFKTDLDGKILVRKSHSEYPGAGDKPDIIHDDLMIVYPDKNGIPNKAIYYDNEGHVINYSIKYDDENKFIILTSELIENNPVFRFTYIMQDDDFVKMKFEISTSGKADSFSTYLEGSAHKKKE